MTEQLEGQMSLFDLDIWSSKMFPDYSAATKGETSRQSSQKLSKSSSQTLPMCLFLTGGGWSKSGCIYDGLAKWSIAWRLHDAQFWGATQYIDGRMHFRGTPQRRKRIALVADFAGLSASEILFERKGLQWNPSESGKQGERASAGTEESIGEPGIIIL